MDRVALTSQLIELSAKMNPRHVVFCRYVAIGSKTNCEAYIEAGYKCKKKASAETGASVLLKRVDVSEFIALTNRLTAVNTIGDIEQLRDDTLSEIVRIGLFNPKKTCYDDSQVKLIQDITDEDAACIKSIRSRVVKTLVDDEGNIKAEIIETEVQPWDKLKALDILVKILKLEPSGQDNTKIGLAGIVDSIQREECVGLPVIDE